MLVFLLCSLVTHRGEEKLSWLQTLSPRAPVRNQQVNILNQGEFCWTLEQRSNGSDNYGNARVHDWSKKPRLNSVWIWNFYGKIKSDDYQWTQKLSLNDDIHIYVTLPDSSSSSLPREKWCFVINKENRPGKVWTIRLNSGLAIRSIAKIVYAGIRLYIRLNGSMPLWQQCAGKLGWCVFR